MPENTAPAATAPQPTGDVPGRPFYETERTKLKRLLHQKRELERQLQITEETIYKKEYDYLEDTPQGNIITGFDGYTKGSTGTQAGGRRRGPMVDMNRVFTRSSITYRTDLVSSPLSPLLFHTPRTRKYPTLC
jgi:chromatin modification-related protein EAF6